MFLSSNQQSNAERFKHLIEILLLLKVLNVYYGNMLLSVWIYHAIMKSFFTVARKAT